MIAGNFPYLLDNNGQLVFDQNGNPIKAKYTFDDFWYLVSVGTIDAAGAGQRLLQTQADADFECTMLTAYANARGAAGAQISQNQLIPINMTIADQASGRTLTSAPIPISSMCGTGAQPYILSVPRIFPAKTTIVFTFANFDTISWDNVSVTMHGRKIYPVQS